MVFPPRSQCTTISCRTFSSYVFTFFHKANSPYHQPKQSSTMAMKSLLYQAIFALLAIHYAVAAPSPIPEEGVIRIASKLSLPRYQWNSPLRGPSILQYLSVNTRLCLATVCCDTTSQCSKDGFSNVRCCTSNNCANGSPFSQQGECIVSNGPINC
jgi:hypothetical protein